MITVRLPTTLRIDGNETMAVEEPVRTIAELADALDRRIPGFRDQLDEAVFNFAVNDEVLLYRARERVLNPGDVVEVIPAISGG